MRSPFWQKNSSNYRLKARWWNQTRSQLHSRGDHGFRKNLVLFDRLAKPMERSQIWLNSFPFWIKIGPCLPEFEKKYLLYAIGVTFGGVIRYEINGDFCRLRIQLDVQKPIRRGIFVLIDNQRKSWISFKYEKLPTFYFGCGRMGHGLKECTGLTHAEKNKIRDDPPYFLALKAELNLIGKESLKFSALSKKMMPQCLYIGDTEKLIEMNTQQEDESTMVQRLEDNLQSIGIEKATKMQEEGSVMEKNEMLNKETVYWKRSLNQSRRQVEKELVQRSQ
ncbi:hypothetical protein Gotri_017484 [Gossypium trilobum]|uniref:Zinc knuckle CX2CX4HX4C domain-containing protein n=1 Tax=Gossypium trilobum TaxID=34281 RepID=A0A7J9E6Z3_9ROSI|nr:hypothetical protein [Gossypium trilobum]